MTPGRSGAPHVLMTTEGTYPFVVGGVSSWCELLVDGMPDVRWSVLPIVGQGRSRTSLFAMPSWASLMDPIELWSNRAPSRAGGWPRRSDVRTDIPARIAGGALAWDGDLEDLLEVLVWCRRHPTELRAAFRATRSWEAFLFAVRHAIRSAPASGAGRPPPLDTYDAARLYQTTYWLARAAASPTPECDLLLVTAAGWAALPALVHRAIHGTPLVLVEHGVYVREAYLANVDADRHGGRFFATRLARGLARAAYAGADVVAPVTDNHGHWERSLGVSPERIRVIYNGVTVPDRIDPPPRTSTIVSVGRVDPLKDVLTMLRVAAEVTRRMPEARFLHYGPIPESRRAYGRTCLQLHEQLGLGDRFRFMGSTSDPHQAVRDADVVLMTSISEGFPLSILEAMAQGRPVVSTEVGGVADALKGCGVLAPAGDVYALTLAVCTLLRDPNLAETLGRRGFDRVRRRFTKEACLDGYRSLFDELATAAGRRTAA